MVTQWQLKRSTHGTNEKFILYFGWKNLKGREFGRPRRRWEDNITTDLREIVWGFVGWIHLAQDRGQWRALLTTVINLWVP
jgi:hypothetical protein